MTDRSLLEQIILDEIAGKNKAIHSYDRILWTVRSGFLTLFFAGWGLMLNAILRGGLAQPSKLIVPMLFVSLGLSCGGFIIDLNYVRRKFRVIAALNQLLSLVLHQPNAEPNLASADGLRKSLPEVMKVSGDTGDTSYRTGGYSNALRVTIVLYFLPLLLLTLGLYIVGLLKWGS